MRSCFSRCQQTALRSLAMVRWVWAQKSHPKPQGKNHGDSETCNDVDFVHDAFQNVARKGAVYAAQLKRHTLPSPKQLLVHFLISDSEATKIWTVSMQEHSCAMSGLTQVVLIQVILTPNSHRVCWRIRTTLRTLCTWVKICSFWCAAAFPGAHYTCLFRHGA